MEGLSHGADGRISKFSLDALIDLATGAELSVRVKVVREAA
jgi:hypothetical protein